MKATSALIAVASTAAVLIAGQGQAQTPTPAPPAPAQRPSTTPPAPAQRPSAAKPAADMTSSHTMEGEVTKVDAKRGWIDVKTPEGRMKLHYPPAALENVKKGDRVTVEVGLRAAK